SGAPDLGEVRATHRPRVEEARIARRPADRDLQLREVADERRQHAGVDLERDAILVHVPPWPVPVRTRIDGAVAHRELDALGEEALVDVEGLLRDLAQRGRVPLPAERTDGQIPVDAFHPTVVDRPVGVGGDMTEPDALGRERLLDPAPFRLCPLASACGLLLQLSAHLAREAGDRADTEEMRGVPLVRTGGPLAVAPHERVLRLRARTVGPALRMAAEASEGIRSSRQTLVDATQPRRVVDRVPVRPAATPAVFRAERIPEHLVPHHEEAVVPR